MSEQMSPEQRLIRFAELLQAFRSTLDEPEQLLLDQMVSGVQVDVQAHAVMPQFAVHSAAVNAAAVNAAATPAASLAAAAAREGDDIEDVAAHAMESQPKIATFEFKIATNGVISLGKIATDAAYPADPAVAEGF